MRQELTGYKVFGELGEVHDDAMEQRMEGVVY